MDKLKFLLAFVVVAFTVSCKKTTHTVLNPIVFGQNSVSWRDGNTLYRCDSAFVQLSTKTLFVYKGSGQNKFFLEVKVRSLEPANYIVSNIGSNAISYLRPGIIVPFMATTGAVQISENTNTSISGGGTAAFSTGLKIDFSIVNTPIR